METRGYAVLKAKAPLEPYSFKRRALRESDIALDITFAQSSSSAERLRRG